MRPTLKEIVIVGGGSAGWMTAAALSSLLEPEKVSITLVESDQIGTIGVGEATIPDILNFNRILGISEEEFMKATQATIKLGIEFVDWTRLNHSYIHPFGGIGVDMHGIDFHHFWLHTQAHGNARPIEDYSLCSIASRQFKAARPDPNPRSPRSRLRYAYHFDATLYARHLRKYAEARGVKRVEGKIVETLLKPENGYIDGVRLDSGTIVKGEFFIDCSGFRALLIGEALETPFNNWNHWLPTDSALAVPCKHNGRLPPYTRSTARKAGWQWRIPTQRRNGNGHVYCSAYMSDDEAADILMSSLDGEALGSPRQIRFKPGHLQEFWKKNCVAIGLSGGFLEPLESTSIYLIQEGISRLISLFPDATLPEAMRKEYNRHMTVEFEQVRDFIILHYYATERDDSPMWNYCRNMSIPDTLQNKLDLFREGARAFRLNEELFDKSSWIAVMLGQNVMPKSYDPIVATIPVASVGESIESMRMALIQDVARMPTHEEFIREYTVSTE